MHFDVLSRAASRASLAAYKLTVVERARALVVVTLSRFVDLPPIQIYAQPLDEGEYSGSISTEGWLELPPHPDGDRNRP
ncbi:MAG: hypothetical protein ACOH2F_11185 [Cellulomonas sp.]